MKLPSWLGYIAAFILAAALSAIAGGSTGLWQAIDHHVFTALRGDQPPQPDPGIRIVDIEYSAQLRLADRPEQFRARIASVLQAIAGVPQPPRIVLIDIWFSNNAAGIEPVIAAIDGLRKRGVRVFVAVNATGRHGAISADPMAAHQRALYADNVDGYGHTILEYGFGVLKYQRELAVPQIVNGQYLGQIPLMALPVIASLDAQQVAGTPQTLVIALGDDRGFESKTLRVASGEGDGVQMPLATTIQAQIARVSAGATHYIVGSLAQDSDNALARPGPLLLAWAVTDLLSGKFGSARAPLNQPWVTVLLAVLAALVTSVGFIAGFHGLRARVAAPHWRILTFGAALAAFLLAVVSIAGAQVIVMAGGQVAPVAWPITCAVIAGGLSLRWGLHWISDRQTRTNLTQSSEELAIAYDVFVSYAHDPTENREWVRDRVVKPLTGLRNSHDQPLKIFFDERSIKVGRQWKREIELALLGTRCFVPIYSDSYFERPYCREEIELADQLRIEGRLTMLPVARVTERIPERYLRKMQYLDTRADTDFAAKLLDAVATVVRDTVVRETITR